MDPSDFLVVAIGLGGMCGGVSSLGGWGAGLTGASGVNVSWVILGRDAAGPECLFNIERAVQ